MRIVQRGILLSLGSFVVSCSSLALDLDGRPCRDGECTQGYVCHPQSNLCVPALAVGCLNDEMCPDSIHEGDSCQSPGSFIPCQSGSKSCDEGCRTCGKDGKWGACSTAIPCDPSVDSTRLCYTYGAGFDDPTLGVGACVAGTQSCIGSYWAACVGQVSPTIEVCNGVDDDCDGQVDVGAAPPSSNPCPNKGICVGASPVCNGAEGWGCDYPFGYEAVEFTCDGLDNDCDGKVDEDLTPLDVCPNHGVCAGQKSICQGEAGWVCDFPDSYEVVEVSCDDLDNDCDGIIDLGTVCSACNDNIDNDGDGAIDEQDVGCSGPFDNSEFNLPENEICSVEPGGAIALPPNGRITGTTVDGGTHFSTLLGTCNFGSFSAPDRVYEVVVPSGALAISARTDITCAECPGCSACESEDHDTQLTTFDDVLYIRDECDVDISQLACDEGEDTAVRTPGWLEGPLAPGVYFVIVDGKSGYASGAGTFGLAVDILMGEGWACPQEDELDDTAIRCHPNLVCVPNDAAQGVCEPAGCPLEGTYKESFEVSGSTTGAPNNHQGLWHTGYASSPGCGYNRAPEHIYRLDLEQAAAEVSITIPEAGFDAFLFVRNGCQGEEIACDDSSYFHSQVILNDVPAGSYYIFVTGWRDQHGSYTLKVEVSQDSAP